LFKKSNNNSKKYIIAFFVGLFLLIFIILLFVYFPNLEKEKNFTNEINVLDDRISPLTNQGLILEVNRIRHRGLLDKIIKKGNDWKTKPDFYLVIEIDGLKISSEDEADVIFNDWDTMFQDIRIIRDAAEEQETSEVKITIIENVKSGLLGIRKKSIEKEKIQLVYDYRTGRWEGDDYLVDNDGYGHYVGEFFEMWFNIYQNDFDKDGIPYWTEVNILGTDPRVDDSQLDPDKDGVPTTWEWRWGYEPFIWDDHINLDPDIDGLENIEEYKMENWFADPFSQDIYVEIDGMERGNIFDWKHVFYEESSQIIIERFCEHGINVYIDNGWPSNLPNGGGEMVPFVEVTSWELGMMLGYYNHHFPDERKGIFRYLLICNDAKFSGNTVFNRYDTIAIGTSKKITHRTRLSFMPRTHRLVLASTAMHELGHTLGILPYTIEGCDNYSIYNLKTKREYLEEWGDYVSVMNYLYTYNKKLVDYSDGSNGLNDQNDWDNLYLPFFEVEGNVVIEPGILTPAKDRIVDENKSIRLNGWMYVENLSQQLDEDIIKSIPRNYKVYDLSIYKCIKNEDCPSDRNIRIYAKPDLSISEWSLIYEGYLHNNTIELVK